MSIQPIIKIHPNHFPLLIWGWVTGLAFGAEMSKHTHLCQLFFEAPRCSLASSETVSLQLGPLDLSSMKSILIFSLCLFGCLWAEMFNATFYALPGKIFCSSSNAKAVEYSNLICSL